MRARACVLLCWALLCLGLVSGAGAVEYFVDNTCAGCHDSNDCSIVDTPTTGRVTINKGIECLNSGDTLTIHGGNYPEYIHDTTQNCPLCKRIPAGTSWATATTVQGKAGETVILKPAFVGLPGYIIKFRAATDLSHYIIIKNLTLDGSLYTGNALLLGGLGVYGPNHHIRCDGCTIQDTDGAGGFYTQHKDAVSGATSNGNEFINGTIQRAGSKHPDGTVNQESHYDHCVYISTSGNIVRNNLLSGCAGLAVHVYRHERDNLLTSNNIIDRNRITRNASCQTLTNPTCASGNIMDGAVLVAGDANQVTNNIVYDVKHTGISVRQNNPDGTLVANNTVCGVTGGNQRGIRVGLDASTTTVVNNLVYRASVPFVDEGTGTVNTTNSFTVPVITDPRFVTPCTNARLTASSPAAARTGGTNLSATFTTDWAGLPRTVPWSMGAYEFGETTGVLHLAFSTPPATAVEGATLAPVRVQVLNEASVLQTGHASNCVISKASGPGTLSGTLSVAPSGGVCTFSTLALSQEGTYQLLVTSAGTTSVTSTAFTITDTPLPETPVATGLKLRGRY